MIGLPCHLIFLFCFSSEDLSLPFVCQTNLSHPVLNFLIAHVILKKILFWDYIQRFLSHVSIGIFQLTTAHLLSALCDLGQWFSNLNVHQSHIEAY